VIWNGKVISEQGIEVMWKELMVTEFEVVRGVSQEPLTSAGYFLGDKGLSGVFPWLLRH
jgi:hypothetical protein